MELVGAQGILRYLGSAEGVGPLDQIRKDAVISTLKRDMTAWLNTNKPPTLGQLIVHDQLTEGTFFTHYSNFFFRGLSKVSAALRKGKPAPMEDGYSKLDDLAPGKRVSFRFHHEHLTSSSAWDALSGQSRLLFAGMIKQITDAEIIAVPWLIADPMPDLFEQQTLIASHWINRLEVHTHEIDQFDKVRDYVPRYRKSDLDVLKNIPERDVKMAIADLLGVVTVPNDWGGELSDLFTPNVTIRGVNHSTAFLFKGPAKFHPMTLADLGKNGDQINRLSAEPADILVVQHCHEITPPVRGMLRAFAQQIGNLRTYCLIDGYHTLQLLEAYSKCGLSPRKLPKRPDYAEPSEGDDGGPEDYDPAEGMNG